MRKTENGSAASALIVSVLGVIALGAIIFALTAYQSKQSAQKNIDKTTAAAVAAAETAQQTKLQAQFDEKAKSPYKTYVGSSTFGSVTFKYPNSWSAYVDETNDSQPINGYFNPGVVPGVQSSSAFALRVQLISSAYNSTLQQYTGQVTQGTITASAFVPPKMKGVTNAQPGTLLTGTIQQGGATPLRGQMLIIPVRDKTLQIYTLSNDYLNDFNNIVLANLTFVP